MQSPTPGDRLDTGYDAAEIEISDKDRAIVDVLRPTDHIVCFSAVPKEWICS